MARMLSAMQQSWCPSCSRPAGPDSPDVGADKRKRKRREAAELKRYYRSIEEHEWRLDMEGEARQVSATDC